MSRFLFLLLLLATLLAISECAKKKGVKGKKLAKFDRKGAKKGGRGNGKNKEVKGKADKKGKGKDKGKIKKIKMDECTKAGHPCMLGQECIVERYTKKERCVCVEHCPDVPDAEVCGSDMMTYPTACHLYKKACDTHRMVFAVAAGPCEKYNKEHLKIEPEMAKACENSHTTFKCVYDKMIERIDSWKKGDQKLEQSDKIIIQDNTLTVRWVMEADQGNYTCVTVDNNGTMKMATATLKMTQMPSANIPSNHISCEHGDQVMIPCEHNEDSQVSWMKNGFELDEGDGMYVDDTGMLVMQQTERDASGTYQCVATNFCGVSKAECSVNVTERNPNKCEEGVELVECEVDPCQDMICEGRPELVCKTTRCGECGYFWEDENMKKVTCPEVQAPEIINTQLVSLTPEGEDAVIPCQATGFPTPTITWTRDDGSSIVGLRKHSLRGNNTLVIRQLVMGLDNGRYSCVAENSAGRAETTVVVAILPRMTPMCPNKDDKIMTCEHDFCAEAKCPFYENNPNVTCVNTVCNVCTYIFVDKSHNYIDCYADPEVLKKMAQMNKMNMGGMGNMGAMPGWPAGSSMGSMGGGHGAMGGMGAMPGWPAGSSMGGMGGMGAMPGWPAGSSMGGMGAMPGWPAGSSMGGMGAMPGWPAGSSMGGMGAMPGWPAGSSMGSMGGGHGAMGGMSAMPGWPAGSSMGGMGAMPGWPAGSSMGGMGAMPGWPAGSSMGGMGAMPGWPAGSSMGGMGAMPGWPAGSSMGSMGGGHGAMGGMGAMPGWPAGSSMGNMGAMPGWPAGSSMGGNMGAMPGWPAGSSMGGSSMGSMSGGSMGGMGGMGMMDKNAWHFVPGWPGHMSQMKGTGKAGGTGTGQAQAGQAQGGHGAGGGGHLNVFYSGKPEDEEEEEEDDTKV